jgi:hypothetical protein
VINLNELQKDEQTLLEKKNEMCEYEDDFNDNRQYRNKYN